MLPATWVDTTSNGPGLRATLLARVPEREPEGRRQEHETIFGIAMSNGKWKIFHISFDISHVIEKQKDRASRRLPSASCLLPPAPASCSCLLPSSRSMQPQAKLIIDCNRLCPSIRKQTTLTQEHWQATRRSFRSECRA